MNKGQKMDFDKWEETFINSLKEMRDNKSARGDLAALRRAAGETIGTARAQAQAVFYSLLPPPLADTYFEETYFLVATLFAIGKHDVSGPNFGETMKAVRLAFDSESLDHRFSAILDSNYDPRTGEGELPYKLRQAINLASSKDVGVDWNQLLRNLKGWNSDKGWVQKQWARSYFSRDSGKSKDDEDAGAGKKEKGSGKKGKNAGQG